MKKIAWILVFTLLLGLLAGCGSSAPAPTPSPAPTQAPPAAPPEAPTPSPTPTPAPTPTPSPTPTPEPTPTPVPGEAEFRAAETLFFKDLNYAEAYTVLAGAEESGYPPLLTLLGLCHYMGAGTPENDDEAYRLFTQASELGYGMGTYWKGLCTGYGYGTPQDTKQAHVITAQAVEEMKAQLEDYADDDIHRGVLLERLGNCYVSGLGDARKMDKEEAKEIGVGYLEEAMALDNADAYFVRSTVNFNTDNPYTIQDPDKTIEWLKKAAELGSQKAMYRLGLAYAGYMGILSEFTDEDPEQARAYLQRCADLGTYLGEQAKQELLELGLG